MKRLQLWVTISIIFTAAITVVGGVCAAWLTVCELLASNGPMATAACAVTTALFTAFNCLCGLARARQSPEHNGRD